MGTFRVNIAVGNPEGQEYVTVGALVDTGSSDTALPASLLQRLGVSPRERWPFELADGRTVEREVGQTWVQIDGRTAIVPVVFADEGTEALLGAVTLEIFRLAVDSVRRRLVPVPGLLKEQPVVRDGAMTVAQMMKATLSVDHRVADGAEAARFLVEIKKLLEHPVSLLL